MVISLVDGFVDGLLIKWLIDWLIGWLTGWKCLYSCLAVTACFKKTWLYCVFQHLPVIQCSTIVRCRSCRTYINPFVYFVDHKRWKCNLCFRVNERMSFSLFMTVLWHQAVRLWSS